MKRTPGSLIFILLVAILLGGVGARFYKIGNPVADWHSWRQADTATTSYIYVKQGIDLLYPRYFDISNVQTGFFNPNGWRFVEFPFFNVLHATAFQYLGHFTFDEWGRLVSIAASSITTLYLFLLARKTVNEWAGIVAAFVYAFLPYNIYFTRVILPEPLGVMFAVVGLYYGVRYFDKGFKPWKILVSAFFFACAILVKPFLGFYGLPVAYMAVQEFGFKKILSKKVLLISLDIALIPFFLWRGWVDSGLRYIGIPFFGWAFNGDNIRFRPSFWNWIFAERLAKMILGMWGVVPFAIGALNSVSKYKTIALSLLGMFLYVSLVATANVRHDYYQTMTVPAIALAFAVGVDWLWNNSSFNKLFSKVLVLFCTFMMLLVGWYNIRDFYQINHPEIILAGTAIDKLAAEDALVVAPYNGDTAFLYQTKRFGWPVVDRNIHELIEMGADYYVSVNFDADTNNFMHEFKTVEKTDRYVILNLHEKI